MRGSGQAQRPTRVALLRALASRMARDLPASFGALVLFGVAVLLIIGPLVAPYGAHEMTGAVLQPPSLEHPFGTDLLGRDLLSRIIFGLPYTVFTALTAVSLAVIVGAALGLVAGYFGGLVDDVIMRICDVIFSFPALLMAIALMAVLGPGLINVVLAMAVVYVPQYARLARASVLSVKELEFITSSKALGASSARIVIRHVLPNIVSPLSVHAILGLSLVVLNEAALSFLGLGAQPPTPSWGLMLSDARAIMELAPWLAAFPTASLVVLLLALNLVGDGLRDVLDPRVETRK